MSSVSAQGAHGNISNIAGVSPIGLPWPLKDDAQYEAECAAHEVVAMVYSEPQLQTLLGSLAYDKRKQGAGRTLQIDLPALGLLRNDRLDPSPLLPNVGDLDARRDFPFRLVFWRAPGDSGWVKHRCPLFSPRSYLSPSRICVDELHTLCLGVFQSYILAAFWQLIDVNVWDVGQGLTQEALVATSVLRLRAELLAWYRAEKQRQPAHLVHELRDLTPSMLGTKRRQVLPRPLIV